MADLNLVVSAFDGEFRKVKKTIESAIAQLSDEQLHERINPQQNAIAAILQHLIGNTRSRFTDFLTTDGEKPTRNREAEFEDRQLSRAELLSEWDAALALVFNTLATLTEADLAKTVTIRNEPHTVPQALVRAVTHAGWHTGQIVLIAKHLKGDGWHYLTTPPGGTAGLDQTQGA